MEYREKFHLSAGTLYPEVRSGAFGEALAQFRKYFD